MNTERETLTSWRKRADMVVHASEPLNAEPPRSALAGKGTTPLDAFYVRNHGPVPKVDASSYRLRVDGSVARPLELSLADLRDGFGEHEVVATPQCAGNRRVGLTEVRETPGEAPWGPGATGTARWRGARLKDVLAAAGVEAEAAHVAFLGADVSDEPSPPEAFGASVPRRKATAPEVLLAWGINDEALPPIHGGPLRVVVPGYIGARSVKWVTRITAQREPSRNHFQAKSYRLLPPEADPDAAPPGEGVPLGAVAVNSDILVPHDGAEVAPGKLGVAGYAFAGDDRSIVRVDVSSDGGRTWVGACLHDQESPWSWRLSEAELDVAPGRRELVARAWDSSAASQPEDPAHLWNPKGYVNNAWGRVSVTVTAPADRS
jgi:sulfite oxidase